MEIFRVIQLGTLVLILPITLTGLWRYFEAMSTMDGEGIAYEGDPSNDDTLSSLSSPDPEMVRVTLVRLGNSVGGTSTAVVRIYNATDGDLAAVTATCAWLDSNGATLGTATAHASNIAMGQAVNAEARGSVRYSSRKVECKVTELD